MTMEVHTFTIKRVTATQGAAGGQSRSYTLAARGTLPQSIKGRAIVMSHREKLEHGVRGDYLGWKFLTPDDPSLTKSDQITFTYIDGQTHTVQIIAPSIARSADGKFYRAIGQEKSTTA